MVGLLQTVLAEIRQVHSTPGLAILLGLNDHSGTPGIWSACRNSLQDTFLYIRFNISPDLVPEVKGNRSWSFTTKWFCVRFRMNFHWLTRCHWPRLASALVKSRILEIVPYPIFQGCDITGRGWHRHGLWRVNKPSSWAAAG